MEDTSQETPVKGSESPVEGRTDTSEGDDKGTENPSRREARYRTERNEARTALEAATARIEQMQRREIERLAGSRLADGSDLWLSENTPADYLDDSGNVDPAKVQADAELLLSERPRLGKLSPAFDPTQGTGGGSGGHKLPTFGDLLGSI